MAGKRRTSLPAWLRHLLHRQAKGLYRSWLFTWMNGEVPIFAFRAKASPIYEGGKTILGIFVLLALSIIALGMVNGPLAIVVLLAITLFVPPLLSAITVIMPLKRWRRTAVLEELATIPLSRDALRSMVILPRAMALPTGCLIMAWMVAIMPPFWIAEQMQPLMAALPFLSPSRLQNSSFDAGMVAAPLFIIFIPLAYIFYAFSCGGIAAGWYLASRFHGPNALVLTMFWGLRVFIGVVGWFILGGYFTAMMLERTGYGIDGLSIGLFGALLLVLLGLYQTLKVALSLPCRRAHIDTVALQRHGVDLLRSPENYREVIGEAALSMRTLECINWPWPRLDNSLFFTDE